MGGLKFFTTVQKNNDTKLFFSLKNSHDSASKGHLITAEDNSNKSTTEVRTKKPDRQIWLPKSLTWLKMS
jgi:hypothetical protein